MWSFCAIVFGSHQDDVPKNKVFDLNFLGFYNLFLCKAIKKCTFVAINEISVNFGTEKQFFVELLVGCSGAFKPSTGDPLSLLDFS